MTVINHKSISGITSITAPAGSDNLLTVHTNDTTERFRIVDSGAIVTGVTTASNFKTGTTNVHNVGVEAAGINVLGADTPIGTGATIYNSGAAVFTGVVTATTFSGNLTGTLNTAAQGNITSLGTLSGLTIDNNANTSMSSGSAGQLVVGGDGYTGAIALDADAMHIYHNSSSRALVFGTNETERLRITGAGAVGIGTNNPQYELHVHPGGATSSGQICAQSEGSNTFAELVLKTTTGGSANIWKNSTGKTDYGGADSLNIYQGANANIAFFTNGNNERLRITSDGKVGINRTTPAAPITARRLDAGGTGTSGVIAEFANSSGYGVWFGQSSASGASWGSTTGDFYWCTGGLSSQTERLRIKSDGNVAINSAGTANNLLDIRKDATSVKTHIGTINGQLASMPNSSEYGISIVGGNVEFGLHKDGSGNYQAILGTYQGSIDIPLVFRTGNRVERLRIGATGNFGFGSTNTAGYSGHTNLFLGGMANLYAETAAASGSSFSLSNNGYINSSGNWVYLAGGKATNIYHYDGKLGFRTAGTGSAGATITWAERFTIEDNHNIYIWGAQTGNDRAILYNGSGYFGIYGSSNNSTNRELRFHTGGGSSTECARFSSGGKLSIGSVAAANISAQKGIEISGGTTAEIRLKNSGGGTGQADGFAIQKWDNGNNYIYDYDSNNILFGTSNGSRTRMDAAGRWTFAPSAGSALTSGSTTIAMSIVNNGGSAVSGSAYPGIAFKSLATGGGNGMSIVNFDGNWDLYSRSGNQQGLAILHSNSSSSGNARLVVGDDGKCCLGTEVYDNLSTSRDSYTALHIAGGGLSIGPKGNNSATRQGGRYVLGWYMMSSYTGHSYIHVVTDLWGGGSPGGNNDYIMGGFHIHGHAYSGNNGQSEERIYFHNWSGGLYGYSRGHWGAWNPGNAAYVNSNGYVTIRLLAGAYRGYIIDLVQHAWYNPRNINVTAHTGSDSGTI